MKLSLILIFSIVSISFADLFPLSKGNCWIFSYYNFQGGWGGGTKDTGRITWKIVDSNHNGISDNQGKVIDDCNQIRIEQKKEIFSITEYPMLQNPDSIIKETLYDPPKTEVCTLSFTGDDQLLVNDSNQHEIIIHDLNNLDRYGFTQERFAYKGDSLNTISIKLKPESGNTYCDNDPAFFTLASDIGPVHYLRTSPQCICDIYWTEEWKLLDNIKMNTPVTNSVHNKKRETATLLNLTTIQIPSEYVTNNTKVRFLQLNGKCIWQKRINGEFYLQIPSLISTNCGYYIIQIISPDKPILTTHYVVNK